MSRKYRFETRQLHVGQENPDPVTDARAVPIYATTSYVFKDSAQAAGRFALAEPGNIYNRLMNPTADVFEKRIAALEGGAAALAVATGAAAITYAIQNIARAGDHIVSAATVYGGTYNLFANTLAESGIETTFVDAGDVNNFSKAIRENTKALYVESLGNPNCDIADMEALAEIAHAHGIPLIVDSTFATPFLFRPLEHRADIVVHSAHQIHRRPRYGNGRRDCGRRQVRLDAERQIPRPFQAQRQLPRRRVFRGVRQSGLHRQNPRHPPAGHGSDDQPVQLLPGFSRAGNPFPPGGAPCPERPARGGIPGPPIPRCGKVNHPSLPEHPNHGLYRKYYPNGGGSIFTFEVKGGAEKARKFCESLELFSLLANVADVKSLVIHPASTTHSQMTEEELKAGGITPSTVRLSIGTEHIDDIIEDLEHGFRAIL